MLLSVISVGVQTWGTDVDALRRYWQAADALGYARITYGDGLGDFTHDGWTMLGALAALTTRARIGPAVTYAVGAEDESAARTWTAHGIAYPSAAERLRVLDASIGVMRELWSTARGFEPV